MLKVHGSFYLLATISAFYGCSPRVPQTELHRCPGGQTYSATQERCATLCDSDANCAPGYHCQEALCTPDTYSPLEEDFKRSEIRIENILGQGSKSCAANPQGRCVVDRLLVEMSELDEIHSLALKNQAGQTTALPELARNSAESSIEIQLPTQTIAQGDYTLVALNQAGEEVASREITLEVALSGEEILARLKNQTPGAGLDANTLDGMSRADIETRLTELAEETVSQEELDARTNGIRSSILDDHAEFTNRVGVGMKPSEGSAKLTARNSHGDLKKVAGLVYVDGSNTKILRGDGDTDFAAQLRAGDQIFIGQSGPYQVATIVGEDERFNGDATVELSEAAPGHGNWSEWFTGTDLLRLEATDGSTLLNVDGRGDAALAGKLQAGGVDIRGPLGKSMMKVDHTGKLSGALDVYMVSESHYRSSHSHATVNLKALCEPGDTILSGGCNYTFSDSYSSHPKGNFPIRTSEEQGWQCRSWMKRTTINVHALCLRRPR